jgi:Uma2 family endonuclease
MPTTAAAQQPVPVRSTGIKSPKVAKRISWQEFQKRYLTKENGYKYEWVNGMVEKTRYTMDKTQLYILRNLLAAFRQLLSEKKLTGELIAEADLFFLENHRRPDVCWLTNEQIDRLAEGEYEVPAFVIEVLSTFDAINRVVDKMQDYRAAKVKTVWHIIPRHQEVHVYTGEQLENMTVCKGHKLCSAAPALPAFAITAQDIFKKSA